MTVRVITRPALIGLVLSVIVLLAYALQLLDTLELKTVDLRFRVRGVLLPRSPLVLVSIDQDSFDEIDPNWPWPRSIHAELIQRLGEGKPKLIGFDLLLPGSTETSTADEQFARALGLVGNVILASEYTEVDTPIGKKHSMSLPAKPLRDQALGHGYVNLNTDRDGVVRRGLLQLEFQDRIYRNFAYEIFHRLSNGSEVVHRLHEPILINYRGPARTYDTIPYYRVLRGEIPIDYFKDKVVLVGVSAPSLHDVFPTPFSPDQPTAGVEIQANLLETLLLGQTISSLSVPAHLLLFIALTGAALFTSLRPGPYVALAQTASVVIAYCVINFYLFAQHYLSVPFAPSFLAMVGVYGGITIDNYVREYQARLQLRAKFGQYVSSEVVDEIMQDQNKLGLQGKRRHITVLFSDVRDFTKISEENDPETIVTLLSDYLGKVTKIVFDNGGTVDKFIGDAVMAIFGAPKSDGNDAERAVKTGAEMLRLAASMAPKWQEIIGRPLKIGVGINTGDAVVGSIGSEIRSDYTAIGDAVNTASRLEGMTKELGVPLLFSEFTAAEITDGLAITSLGKVQVIGRATALGVFTTADLAVAHGISAVDPAEVRRQQHK